MENIKKRLNENQTKNSICLSYDSDLDKKIRIHIQHVEEKLRSFEREKSEKSNALDDALSLIHTNIK